MRRVFVLVVLVSALAGLVTLYHLQISSSEFTSVRRSTPRIVFLPSTTPSRSRSPSTSPSNSQTPSPSPSQSPSPSPTPPPPSPSASSSPTPSIAPSSSPLWTAVPKLTPLALAIVFPQFHPIPENDELWGINFTEWTYLKPMPRYVYDEVIYKPHPELGYYNILDFEHRRFMRVLADRFGVYGFCIYHFWFKDHPGMCYPTSMRKEVL